MTSDSFPITNAMRQGCPLSPPIFALFLEPFLCYVRLNPNISGVKINQTQYKVSAYADDLMFSITNPTVSLPNLLWESTTYGALSNQKINLAKSEAMGVGIRTSNPALNLKWTNTALKYLGRIYELNFPPLLKTVKTLLTQWHTFLHGPTFLARLLQYTENDYPSETPLPYASLTYTHTCSLF